VGCGFSSPVAPEALERRGGCTGAPRIQSGMKHWMPASLLAVAIWTPAASAREPAPPCRSDTAAMLDEDANGDARVTLLEARAAALALFEHFDRDGDGGVTRTESDGAAASWREQRLERRFSALDGDRDGTLSRAEVALSPRRFVQADRDADGRLTRAEVSDAFERGSSGRIDTAALRSMFWRRDSNRDGRVTRMEVLAAADRRFMRRDRDGDGVVAVAGEQRARR
jgi:Ca2+-binding EF-hand superfamily protein